MLHAHSHAHVCTLYCEVPCTLSDFAGRACATCVVKTFLPEDCCSSTAAILGVLAFLHNLLPREWSLSIHYPNILPSHMWLLRAGT